MKSLKNIDWAMIRVKTLETFFQNLKTGIKELLSVNVGYDDNSKLIQYIIND